MREWSGLRANGTRRANALLRTPPTLEAAAFIGREFGFGFGFGFGQNGGGE
jgi:hypothetical protein